MLNVRFMIIIVKLLEHELTFSNPNILHENGNIGL